MPDKYRRGFVVMLIISLTLAGGALLWTAGAQQADGGPVNGTITVGATGAVSESPDIAVIDIAVEASADSADDARGTVADTVDQLRTALTDANVSDDHIRTTFFIIQTEHHENGTITYHAVHGLELRVPVDNAGSAVDTAVAGSADRVDSVQFKLTEETRRELRDDALEMALDNARADADVIATAIGVEVDSVKSVETSDGGVGPVFEVTRGGATTFDPGPVTVTAHVTVTYRAS